MPAREVAPSPPDDEYRKLLLLRDDLGAAGIVVPELEHRIATHERRLTLEKRRAIAARLTPKRIRFLEHLMVSNWRSPTQREAEEWFAAVEVSQPPATHQWVEEQDVDVRTKAEREWDAWYRKPISESLFARNEPVRQRRRLVRPRAHRATRRRTATRRGPPREADESDLDRRRLVRGRW